MSVEAKHIAKYFYDKNNELTDKQLQKLTYYAYAWYLTICNERLFEESPQAWIHGPVFMSLYKDMQNNKIIETDTRCIINNEKIVKILDVIYRNYGKLSGYKLELMTHEETPWKNARKGLKPTDKSRNIILDEDIKEYFEK